MIFLFYLSVNTLLFFQEGQPDHNGRAHQADEARVIHGIEGHRHTRHLGAHHQSDWHVLLYWTYMYVFKKVLGRRDVGGCQVMWVCQIRKACQVGRCGGTSDKRDKVWHGWEGELVHAVVNFMRDYQVRLAKILATKLFYFVLIVCVCMCVCSGPSRVLG